MLMRLSAALLPHKGERKCACIGGADCVALQKSGDCKSRFKWDESELRALICSCTFENRLTYNARCPRDARRLGDHT